MPVNNPRVQLAKKKHADKSIPVPEFCTTLRMSRPTLYRYLGSGHEVIDTVIFQRLAVTRAFSKW